MARLQACRKSFDGKAFDQRTPGTFLWAIDYGLF